MSFIVIYNYKKCQKNALQESYVINFTWVFGNYTAKNVDIVLKFCMRVICTVGWSDFALFVYNAGGVLLKSCFLTH